MARHPSVPGAASERDPPDPLRPLFTFELEAAWRDDAGATDEVSRMPGVGDNIEGWRLVRAISVSRTSAVFEVERLDDPGPAWGVRAGDFHPPDGLPLEVGDAWRGVLGAGSRSVRSRAAMKVFDFWSMDAGAIRRFRLHATLLSEIRHEGVVGVDEWGVSASRTPYIVMELVRGTTFDSWAAIADPTAAQRVEVLAQAAESVGAVHAESGLVHRDMKPANLMVEPARDGAPARARVIDFGTALVTTSGAAAFESLATEGGAIVGTPAYMAPEQLHAGARVVDARADVYALGVMLYETLAGERPVRTEGLSLVEIAAQKARPTPSVGALQRVALRNGRRISRALAQVVLTAISPDAEDRQRDGRALAVDLRRAARGLEPSHRPMSLSRRTRRFLAREPRLAAALVASAVIAVVGSAAIGVFAVHAERARQAEQEQTDRLVAMVKSWSVSGFLAAFNTPGSEEALIAMTEAVIRALEEAKHARPDDVDLVSQLAVAYSSLAIVVGAPVARSLGDEPRACELFDKAIEAARRTVELTPGKFEHDGRGVGRNGLDRDLARLTVANMMKRRASVTADASERIALLEEAAGVTEELHRRWPDNEEIRSRLAGALGILATEQPEDLAAVELYDRAIDVLGPSPALPARGAAHTHARLILHLERAARAAWIDPVRAGASLEIVRDLLVPYEDARVEDPMFGSNAMHARLFARCDMIDAQCAAAVGRWDDAESQAAACRSTTTRLVELDPSNGVSILDHAVRCREHGAILLARCARDVTLDKERRQARLDEVIRLGEEAVAWIYRFRPERPRTRHERAELDACDALARTAESGLDELASVGAP